MGSSRQEYWSGLPFPSPGDLPNPGIESGSPACRWFLALQILHQPSHQGSPKVILLTSPPYRRKNGIRGFGYFPRSLSQQVGKLGFKPRSMCPALCPKSRTAGHRSEQYGADHAVELQAERDRFCWSSIGRLPGGGIFQMWELWAGREWRKGIPGVWHYAGQRHGVGVQRGVSEQPHLVGVKGALLENKSPQDAPCRESGHPGTGAPSGKNLLSWIFAQFIPLFHSGLCSDVTSSKRPSWTTLSQAAPHYLSYSLKESSGGWRLCSPFSQHGEYCPAQSGHQHTFVWQPRYGSTLRVHQQMNG